MQYVKQPFLLIVEDDPGSQVVYRQLAKRYSFEIEIADNGTRALDIYRENPKKFTHVIMDLRMPAMNGFDCAREIRKIQRTSRCFAPVLCITAQAMAGDRDKCLREGMDDYMAKPFSIGQFIDLLARWSALAQTPNPPAR